ncbi:hypothetical protein HS088_TW03G00767 [Tripterygium wilfordii]|uniref:Uncharacterized protein n=1 Tax=Tripterygium wilfordii TaxID=458696 RepID=A0A7J7DVV0_TRIWF|nr:hypothetical protein HS088_TW03G00767 [Tripterygium wilfordii]
MAYHTAMHEENLRKGPWLEEEDERLITYVTLLGERRWDSLARSSEKFPKQGNLFEKGEDGTYELNAEDGSESITEVSTGTRFSDSHSLPNYAVASSSPYEIRLSEWIMGMPDDQSEVQHHSYSDNSLDCSASFSYSAWNSEERDVSTAWDCSGNLWNIES